MTDIYFRKINAAFIKIESDRSIALELSESLSYDVPGAKFISSYKNGSWDGKIRLFNLGSRQIASGLVDHIIEWAKKREYTYEIVTDDVCDPPGYKTPNLDYLAVKEYMESLNLHAGGHKLIIREYQVDGVYAALHNRNAILLSSVGSGKSMMLYCIVRYISEELSGRVLLIVPTVGLTSQILNDFKDYSSDNGFDADANVHMISSGVSKETRKPIVISTFQSLKDVSPDWLNSFKGIISDEGHKIQAASFKAIYGKATEVPFRLACTGTLHDMKVNVLEMIALTGPVHDISSAKSLIEAGQLVPMKIKAVILNYPDEIKKAFTKVEYADEIGWITTNEKRNNFIRNLAARCKGTTLILFRFQEHGQTLYDKIKEAVGDLREVHLIDGNVSKDDREEIRLSSNNTDAIVIASYGTTSAGVNLPAIENIIIAHPVKSKITLLQSIGRGLRLKAGKTHCNLYDIGDNISWKSHVNHTFKHFGERLKLMTAEGYVFDIVNMDFK
jgi:superfamily II DNA or RNA helicase